MENGMEGRADGPGRSGRDQYDGQNLVR